MVDQAVVDAPAEVHHSQEQVQAEALRLQADQFNKPNQFNMHPHPCSKLQRQAEWEWEVALWELWQQVWLSVQVQKSLTRL